MYADQQLTQLFKRRCGVGVDISTLRPNNMEVKNSAKTTTGAISFMDRFSNTTREVAQNSRRGALIITIDVNHPDIKDFITIKQDLKRVTGANISVKISDEFMNAVENDTNFTLKFPVESETPTYTQEIRAKELWDLIIHAARNYAEPGLIFWTTQHEYSTSSVYPDHKNISTNPCSEIAMDNDSCRLIANNMFNCVVNPYTKDSYFDFDKWYEINYEAQRLMDDLVDLELESVKIILDNIISDPEPDHIKAIELKTWEQLYKNGKKNRRTGLGFTALGDTLAALNIKYDSNESLLMVEDIMKKKCEAEFDSSIDMAIERGSFDGFDVNIENTSKFVMMLKKELPHIYDRMMKYGRRNISLSTIAPTGTLSILTQTTSGIEPLFLESYKRRKKLSSGDDKKADFVDDMGDKWEEFIVYHHGLAKWKNINKDTDISLSPYRGCTAEELDWRYRVNLQGVCQKYTTHSISSTINLKSDVSEETVSQIYMESWKKGLKGITVYRDGSRSGVLISTDEKKEEKKDDMVCFSLETHAHKRPKMIECEILRFQNNKEKWIGFVGLIDGKPYEIFTGLLDSFQVPTFVEKGFIRKIKEFKKDEEGKDVKNSRYDFVYIDKEGYEQEMKGLNRAFDREYWNYGKLVSGILRHGMPLYSVVSLIDSLHLVDSIVSWKSGVKRMLKKYILDPVGDSGFEICPSCGEMTYKMEGGCGICINAECGYSKCS